MPLDIKWNRIYIHASPVPGTLEALPPPVPPASSRTRRDWPPGPLGAGPGSDGLVLFERELACWVCGTNKNKTHPDSETLTEGCLSRCGARGLLLGL